MAISQSFEQTPVGTEPGGAERIIDITSHPRTHEGVFLTREGSEKIETHLAHGRVSVGSDLVDWTLEVPERLSYYGVAIFVPGYLGIKQSSREPRKALAQEGIASVSYNPAREDGLHKLRGVFDPQYLHERTIRKVSENLQDRQEDIAHYIPNVEQLDMQRKILFLHSMGGLAGPRHALKDKGVERIIGLATCGFGHPTPAELSIDIPRGLVAALKHELVPGFAGGAIEMSMRNIRDITRYYSRMRVLFEGLSCVSEKVHKEVATLESRGVPYNYLGFENDILVRPHEDIGNHVASFTVMEKYGHLAPQVKAQKVARAAVELSMSA